MLERQYCASAYTINFKDKTILLMYNKKLNKWLQPGGHIEGKELPEDTAIRETFEETGIKIKIIGNSFKERKYEPIAVERYINKVGDMIDIQYVAIPETYELKNDENNNVVWMDFEDFYKSENVDDEIKTKVKYAYEMYK